MLFVLQTPLLKRRGLLYMEEGVQESSKMKNSSESVGY